MRKYAFFIHPACFTLFPILFLYSHNIHQTEFRFALIPGLIALSALAGLFYPLNLWMKDPSKTAVLLSAGAVLFFSYGHLYEFIDTYGINRWLVTLFAQTKREVILYRADQWLHGILLGSGTVLFALIAKKCLGSRRDFTGVTRFLSVVSVLLVLTCLPPIARAAMQTAPAGFTRENPLPRSGTTTGRSLPDIYYIILDGYPRSDMLKRYYKFDNAGFIKALRSMGFYVPEASRSNYSETILSLASSLNFRYLEAEDEKALMPKERNDRFYFEMIRNSDLLKFLKKQGYQTIHLASIWSGTARNPHADIEIAYERSIFRNEFYRVLFRTTPLRVLDSFMDEDIAQTHLYNLNELARIAERPGPTFAFAHLILPHDPYVFDRNGRVTTQVDRRQVWDHQVAGKWSDQLAFREQTIFTSKALLDVAKHILERSDTEPIIIAHSDHGTNLIFPHDRPEMLELRLANFIACYFPGGDASQLYDSITPVNLFRIVLDRYFGTGLGLLEDRSIYTGSG